MTLRYWPHAFGLASRAYRTFRTLWVEDTAQDLVEYAYLAAFIATAGMLALNAIGVSIFNTYSDWMNPAIGVPSLWAPPEPPSGGS